MNGDGLRSRLDRFCRSNFSLTAGNWDLYKKIVPTAHVLLRQLSHPRRGPLLKKLIEAGPEDRRTQNHIVPISKEIDYRKGGEGTPAPTALLRKAIEEASYRVILNKCVCRDGTGCRDYPIDLGCIFLGEACRHMVRNGIAHEVTAEEALAHLDRAAELGLVALCNWVTVEAALLGIPPEEEERFMEICLCCPCCCLGFQNFRHMSRVPKLRAHFNSVGWRAAAGEECSGCGACTAICPMQCITLGGEGIEVGGDCIGCGLCAFHCPEKAIRMEAEGPLRDSIVDYFHDIRLRLD